MPATAPVTNNVHRQYSAEDRRALEQFDAQVRAANGYEPGTPTWIPQLRRTGAGRPRRGADLTSFTPPTTYRPPQGFLMERDTAYTFSRDGRRIYSQTEHRPRKVVSRGPVNGGAGGSGTRGTREQPWSEWEPMPLEDSTRQDVGGAADEGRWEDDGDDAPNTTRSEPPHDVLDANGEHSDDDDSSSQPQNGSSAQSQPAKRYQSSDDPMSVWLPLRDQFMGAVMMREDAGERPTCSSCGRTWTDITTENGTGEDETDALFRCTTCGEFLECGSCTLRRHERSPLHMLRKWGQRGFFERVTLLELGLTYQLGHGGSRCVVPRRPRIVTVMHTNGIHRVRLESCGCDLHGDNAGNWKEPLGDGWYPATTSSPQTFATFEVLNLYRRLNCTAHVNVRDFVTVLERLTDPLKAAWIPDRYKSFGLMSRQWTSMQRMRRRGLGHLPGGIATAGLGSAAVVCWACPRPKVNLPSGWETVAANLKFKYAVFLGLDANFRMESKLRKKSSNKAYPILADGLGCIVPSEDYANHLRKYVKEEDVSTCIAFAALMQKETRASSGLRCTGIGGCICTRHEIIRRIGDLLKGERYANMDYVFWSALLGEEAAEIMVSYDIGCQWKVNLRKRRDGMPALLRADPGLIEPLIRVALPVWHGAVHEEDCSMCNSLRYKTGAGMTEGEGVERVWSLLNPCATATKEMHADARHENLEDAIDNHNFEKNLGLATLIPRRLEVAKEERAKQLQNFQSSSLALGDEIRKAWEGEIKQWHEQEDLPKAQQTVACPYIAGAKKEMLSVKKVRQELEAEEEAFTKELAGGILPKGRRTSQTMFLTICHRLEDLQRRILDLLKARVKLGKEQEDQIAKMRTSFWKGLPRLRALQDSYMSGVRVLIDGDEEEAATNGTVTLAESVKLWLPWQVPSDARALIGRPELYVAEARLRRAQCSSALTLLRIRLHAKRHLIMFRNAYCRGQRKTGRARTFIDSVSDRVDAQARLYRAAREALFQLEGEEGCGEFRKLEKDDIQLHYVQDHDGRAARRLAKIAGRSTQAMMQGTADLYGEGTDSDTGVGAEERGESRRTLSWIWTAQGAPDDSDEYLHDSIKVEWCKSYARKERWREEVLLGEEEKRRVPLSIQFEAHEWRKRADVVFGSIDERRGRRAYALRQVAVYETIHGVFLQQWSTAGSGTKRKRGSVADEADMPEGVLG